MPKLFINNLSDATIYLSWEDGSSSGKQCCQAGKPVCQCLGLTIEPRAFTQLTFQVDTVYVGCTKDYGDAFQTVDLSDGVDKHIDIGYQCESGPPSGGGNSVGLIVGCTVGGIILVALIALFVYHGSHKSAQPQ